MTQYLPSPRPRTAPIEFQYQLSHPGVSLICENLCNLWIAQNSGFAVFGGQLRVSSLRNCRYSFSNAAKSGLI